MTSTKRWGFMLLLLSFLVSPFLSSIQASDGEVVTLTKEEKLKRIERAKELAKKQLDNTRWEITVRPTTGAKEGYPKNDMLVFEDGKFKSEDFESKGYSPTNYYLRIQHNGIATWETMQSEEGKGVIFWRGDRRGRLMSGVISVKSEDGRTEGYSFKAIRMERTAELAIDKGVAKKIMREAVEALQSEIITRKKEAREGVSQPKKKPPRPVKEKPKKRWWHFF